MSKNITAKWDTAKGHGFVDGQQIRLFGFDQSGPWAEEETNVVIFRREARRIVLKMGRRQVWAGGFASKFWAAPVPELVGKRPTTATSAKELTTEAKRRLSKHQATVGEQVRKATAAAKEGKKATPVNAPVETPAEESTQDKRMAALKKAQEARKAAANAPAPEVRGILFQTSGKHGIKEGGTFAFHGDSKADGPTAKPVGSPKLTMKIVDRVWITGVDSKGKEWMRAHIAKSFWAVKLADPAPAKAPAKKATEAPAKATAKAPAKAPAKKATPAKGNGNGNSKKATPAKGNGNSKK